MYNHDRDSMNEMDFDYILENSIPELPPDDVVKDVTPWRKAMNRVLVGITFTVININYFGIDYIFPIIGAILCLLGFISLRKENRWFKYCLIITVINIVNLLPSLILDSTIFHSIVSYPTSVLIAITVINTLLRFLLFFFLLKGFSTVCRKVNLQTHAKGVVGLIVWYAVLCLASVFHFGGSVIGIILIVAYVFIIRSLVKFSKQLDEAGYSIKPTTVRVPEWTIVTGTLTILVVGITCGYLFFNSYPMDWQLAETSTDAEVEEIKEELIELGFPETILEDLTDEDIKACDGAVRVVIEDGNRYGDEIEELKITGVGVELPDEQWKIFHHFIWTNNPSFYGTEALKVCDYNDGIKYYDYIGEFSGQVLYDKDGHRYVASYYSLTEESYISDRFGERVLYTDTFATFSRPRNGENHRGYLSYTILEIKGNSKAVLGIEYIHQGSWLQYPVVTAVEDQKRDSWDRSDAFKTVQELLQVEFGSNAEDENS